MALETGEFEVNRSFIGVGDEYVEHREKPLHHIKGVKQFLTTSPKHGQTAGTFGGTYEIKPLYSGEPYVEPGKGTTREKMKSRERYINPRGFVPSSPAKKMTGPGSYDGAFTEYEHLDDGVFPKREEPPKMKKDFESRRPILTSPPKRGGPGVPGVLLGPTPEHKADSYGEVEERRKKEAAEHRAKMGDRKAFRATVASRGDPLDAANQFGVSGVYALDEKCLPPKPDPEFGKTRKQLVDERKVAEPEKPFVQSSPGKKGPYATLSPYPARSVEEYDPKKIQDAQKPSRLMPASKRTQGLPEKLRDRPAFKPSSSGKSGVTRSIAHARIHAASIGMSRAGRR